MDPKFIRLPSGSEYSTEYGFFRDYQVVVFAGRDGTFFSSRLDGMRFLHTKRRKLPDDTIDKLCRHIHRLICSLNYGGEPVM